MAVTSGSPRSRATPGAAAHASRISSRIASVAPSGPPVPGRRAPRPESSTTQGMSNGRGSARRRPTCVVAEALAAPGAELRAATWRWRDRRRHSRSRAAIAAAGTPAGDRASGRGRRGWRRRAPGGRCRRSRCSAAAGGAASVDPEGEDALIGAAELSGAGEHAAAIDPDRKSERGAVLERQLLARQLGRAVERDRRLRSRSPPRRRPASAPAGSAGRGIGLEGRRPPTRDRQSRRAAGSSRRGWC